MTVIFSDVHADNLANVDEGRDGASDPYVVWSVNGERLCKTEWLRDSMGHSGTAKPVWGGEYGGRLPGAAAGATVDVELFDYDRKGIHVSLGKASFTVDVAEGSEEEHSQEVHLVLSEVPDGRDSELAFSLRLSFEAPPEPQRERSRTPQREASGRESRESSRKDSKRSSSRESGGGSREGTPQNGAGVTVTFSNVHADNLANVDEPTKDGRAGASDPYVVWSANGVRLCKTEVLKDSMGHSGTAKPVWGGEYSARLPGAAAGARLDVELFDFDRKGAHISLGKASFTVDVAEGSEEGHTQEVALMLSEVPAHDPRDSEVAFSLRLSFAAAEDGKKKRSSTPSGRDAAAEAVASEGGGERPRKGSGSRQGGEAKPRRQSGDPNGSPKPRPRSRSSATTEAEPGAPPPVLKQKSKKGRGRRSTDGAPAADAAVGAAAPSAPAPAADAAVGGAAPSAPAPAADWQDDQFAA